ncbi:MAG TPA: DUF1501 domain-containing protein [Tepidisphaeraceae bacterium]|jgi:hypothetical protein|nr:DUF1501 domain-containing protein [Tepidisphaeraceae bacterium]
MLNIGDENVRQCSGASRRAFLQAGAASLAGLSLPLFSVLKAAGAVNESAAKIKNCIVLFLVGSPGQLDTWDMKPDAPSDIRGKFKPIRTNVPGIQICEHFPLMARMMDKVALIRSLYYKTGASHENGQRFMMTGHDFTESNIQPYMGSVISRVFGPRGDLPASILLPAKIGNTGTSTPHGQAAGYLGSGHEPFILNGDPAKPSFKIENLEPPPGQTEFRINARRDLLKQIDDIQRRPETNSTLERDTAYSRAFNLLLSPSNKEAFELNSEPANVRDRYGRNTFGQSCLMARRLIEHGTRFVTVNHFDTVFNISCWDMHSDGGGLNNSYADYEHLLCPQFDVAFTALIEDLESRGLLKETVVAVLSEFGRTPKLNKNGGRDHYPSAYTNFLCGGPIRGGQAIGSTDKLAAAPHDYPIEPPRIVASIYKAMGIDLETTMMAGPGNRPIRLIDAEPIPELF